MATRRNSGVSQHPTATATGGTPVTLAGYLARRGLPVSEEDLVATLDRMLSGTFVPASAAALTAGDEAFLASHSGVTPASDEQVAAAMATTAAQWAALVETSLSAADVARQVARDPSTVRHWISDEALYPVHVGEGGVRLPWFQFTDTGWPLPGLRQVLAAFGDGRSELHPLSMLGFFTSPKPELEINGEPVSPRDWLASGGDPRPVAALAAGLGDTGTVPEHPA